MFKQKAKQIFTSWRVIILIVFLVLAVVAISPRPWVDGVAIRSVITNSPAAEAGIPQPSPASSLVSRERILEINNRPIESVEAYYLFTNTLRPNQSVQIKTNKAIYRLTSRANNTPDLGVRVFKAPKTNIRKGLDLQGGTRVLLEPETKLAQNDLNSLIDNMEERLNVYGLSDLSIKDAKDLTGNQFILVEIAGANEEEIRDLLAKQGKFEAKIGNETAFVGGQDIVYVSRSADSAGIDPNFGCQPSGSGYVCRFRFSIAITPEAAKRHARITDSLEIISDPSGESYLSKPLELYLDDVKVDELSISSTLKGSDTTEIQISGSGTGNSLEEAQYNSIRVNMKQLQTVLITGSLPVKLNIVKVDSVSPLLGDEFLRNAMVAGFFALLAVGTNIFIRYRKLQIAVPIMIISLFELILVLGVAAIIGWNIDLAAVAGIIIAIGTGVDHQIVISDETLRGERFVTNWRERIKNAFSIIMGAYFTIVVAMIPLIFAGAGLLKGFAITTIIGASLGVFVSRPAFARIIEIMLK